MSRPPRDSLIAHPLSVVLAISTVILWGGTAVANRFAVDTVPPVAVGGVRFGMATLFMLGWCLVDRSPLLLERGQWGRAWVLGVLLFLQISTFNIGVAHSNASHASLLVNSFVFWVAAYEHFVSRSMRLRAWQLLGLMLAAGGCITLFVTAEASTAAAATSPAGSDRVTYLGDFILLLSGFILAVKILLTKWALRGVSVGSMILWHDLIGTVLFFGASGLLEDHSATRLTIPSVTALLYAGFVISGFCFGVNAWLLKRHSASQVAVFSFASPVCGVALGVLLRGDALTEWLLVSGGLVGVGILLVNLTVSQLCDVETPRKAVESHR